MATQGLQLPTKHWHSPKLELWKGQFSLTRFICNNSPTFCQISYISQTLVKFPNISRISRPLVVLIILVRNQVDCLQCWWCPPVQRSASCCRLCNSRHCWLVNRTNGGTDMRCGDPIIIIIYSLNTAHLAITRCNRISKAQLSTYSKPPAGLQCNQLSTKKRFLEPRSINMQQSTCDHNCCATKNVYNKKTHTPV